MLSTVVEEHRRLTLVLSCVFIPLSVNGLRQIDVSYLFHVCHTVYVKHVMGMKITANSYWTFALGIQNTNYRMFVYCLIMAIVLVVSVTL